MLSAVSISSLLPDRGESPGSTQILRPEGDTRQSYSVVAGRGEEDLGRTLGSRPATVSGQRGLQLGLAHPGRVDALAPGLLAEVVDALGLGGLALGARADRVGDL